MLTGHSFIAGQRVTGTDTGIEACNPATGVPLPPTYHGVTADHVDTACRQALQAFGEFRRSSAGRRAELLDMIAEEINRDGEQIVARAMLETGLSEGRLQSELARTCGQSRLFARLLRSGLAHGMRISNRATTARPDLRQMRIGLGPVVIFGASNFPLAFSVAGGDSASALAAGCPIVVKAHPAHPGVSELTAQAVVRAVARSGLPAGIFSMLFGPGNEIGVSLVRHPAIAGVGFTGSRSGGLALMKVATYRPVPIPVHAEMSSINPVFLLPAALSNRAESIAADFVQSLSQGAGQFCTSPGLLIAMEGDPLERFETAAIAAIRSLPLQTMLSPGIHQAYLNGVESLLKSPNARPVVVAESREPGNACSASAALFSCQASAFLTDERLRDEVFGACALIVRCTSTAQMIDVASHLEGQLTAALQADEPDASLASELLFHLETRCGRLIYNQFGTGVDVCDAMVHGGPFPATSDTRSTSVGTAAIERWLRPICYQSMTES